LSLEVSNVKLEKTEVNPGEYIMITFTVTNRGGNYVLPKYTITADGAVLKEDYARALGGYESVDVADMIRAPLMPGRYQICVSVTAWISI